MLLNPTKGYASACRCQMAQKQRKKEEKEIGSAPFAPQKNKRKKQCRRKSKKGDCAAYRIHRFGFKMRTEHPFQNSAGCDTLLQEPDLFESQSILFSFRQYTLRQKTRHFQAPIFVTSFIKS